MDIRSELVSPRLRENHSGMETQVGGGVVQICFFRLRENHSGMETGAVLLS